MELFKGLIESLDYEQKYVFSNGRLPSVLGYVQYCCLPDPLFPYNVVSSIYFDTVDLRSLNEKVNSDHLKSKYRIRWYSESELEGHGEVSFLEVKRKTGTARKKRKKKCEIPGWFLDRAELTADAFFEISLLLRAEGELFGESLFPTIQITYKRWRFVEPVSGARICVDCDISAPKANTLFFAQPPSLFLENGVFEIKGPFDELPRALTPVLGLGCRKESFSKYKTCFERMKRG